jgi:hypothetical protein
VKDDFKYLYTKPTFDLYKEVAKMMDEPKVRTTTEYVIRRDSESQAFVTDSFSEGGFIYGPTVLEKAKRFPSANAAADAIAKRKRFMASISDRLSVWRYSILPVTVVTTPAQYETKRIEVSPASTTVTLA